MIRFEDALGIISQAAVPLQAEPCGLQNCLNRVLVQDVYSDMDMPPFNKSAVDGYACRQQDLGLELSVLEVIPAGKAPQHSIGPGQCSKLMTGGMLPEGADMVVMVEDTNEIAEGKIRFTASHSARNFTLKAEDIRRNDLVVSKGTHLRPQEIAILASVGCHTPLVSRKPAIGVISTGDELVEPDAIPALSQIRNSNGWQLLAQAVAAGCEATYFGIAPDNEEVTFELIQKAAAKSDIVILSGGISAGDFDFVPAVIERAGFKIKFRSMAVQPGKPVIFAVKGSSYLFALPGNPVSSFVQFEMLVRHLINLMTGSRQVPAEVTLPMAVDYNRKKSERRGFFPVQITTEGTVVPVEYHGSAHIHAYVPAQGIVSIAQGDLELKAGTKVHVRLV